MSCPREYKDVLDAKGSLPLREEQRNGKKSGEEFDTTTLDVNLEGEQSSSSEKGRIVPVPTD